MEVEVQNKEVLNEEKNFFENYKEFNDEKPIIDQILDRYGYGLRTINQLFIFFLTKLLEGCLVVFWPLIVHPLRDLHKLSDTNVFLISASFFIGGGIGSAIAASVTKILSRPRIIYLMALFIAVTYFIIGLIQNLTVFWVLRFMQGIFLGIIVVVSQNRVTEYLPIKWRALFISVACMGNPFGGLTIAMNFKVLMPDLDHKKIPITMYYYSILILLIFLYKLFMCKSSPRQLILANEDEEAFDILENLNGQKLRESDKRKIIDQVRLGMNTQHANSGLGEIFKEDYLKTTIFLCLIFTVCGMAFKGPILFSTFTIKKLGGENLETKKNVILHQFTIMSIILPMQALGGLLAEIKFFGRRLIMVFGFIMCFMLLALCTLYYNNFSIFLGLSLAVITIPFTISAIYASEIYNTIIRDQAVGFLCLFRFLGGLLAQLFYLYINRITLFMPYYFTMSLLTLGAALAFLLPYETYRQPLDMDMSSLIVYSKEVEEEKHLLKKDIEKDKLNNDRN
jgi:sugar phosphate permease